MLTFSQWLKEIEYWYDNDNPSNVKSLRIIVNAAPDSLFIPPFNQNKSDAIAYFVDACVRIKQNFQQNNSIDESYNYQQFCYAKLQSMACACQTDIPLKRWCVKKLDALVISMLEFCQQQGDPIWLQESENIIKLHAVFMNSLNDFNLFVGDTEFY